MTLEELGAVLRASREARGISLDSVAGDLRIPRRILAEIEEGGAGVPRSVFTLNFIKQYARRLGHSPEEVAEMTTGLEGFEAAVRPSVRQSAVCTPVRHSAVPAVLISILKTVFILAAAAGAYFAYLHFFAGRETPPAVQPMAQPAAQPKAPAAVVQESPAPSGMQQENPGGADASAVPAVPAGAGVPQSEGLKAPSVKDEPPVVTAEALRQAVEAPAGPVAGAPAEAAPEAPAAPAPETPPLPEGMHQVEVISDNGDCWMGFEPDGKKQQRTLRKGDTFSMTFRDSLVVRLGNAQAVRVLYDGRELTRSGSSRVVTLTFPPRQ